VKSPTPPLVNRSAGVVTPMSRVRSLYPGSRYGEMKPQSIRALTTAKPPLPSILSFCIAYGLPLHVPSRIGAAAGERLYVIFPVAWASAARLPGGGAGMLALKFPCYLTGSVLSR
jgi:hypothetical protein